MNVSIFANDLSSAKQISNQIQTNTEFSVLYSGNDIAKFLASKKCLMTNVLIIDYTEGKHDLKVMLSKIRRINERIQTIFMIPDKVDVNWEELLTVGSNGFIEKATGEGKLSDYLNSLAKHGAFISPKLTTQIFDFFRTKESTNEMMLLPKKSHKVLAYLSEGLKYDEIAVEMNTSINSIRYYIKQIYTILGVDNKGAAISIYMKGKVKLK